jgi:hypothetical protein
MKSGTQLWVAKNHIHFLEQVNVRGMNNSKIAECGENAPTQNGLPCASRKQL